MVVDGAWGVTEQREDDPYRAAQKLMKEKRFAEAFRIYVDLASQGDSWAQVRIGWMHFEGVGVPRDSEQARKWFQQAASLGSASGEFYSGRLAAAHNEWDEAIKWFSQAAQKEYGPALLWLGVVYLRGYGVPANLQKAVAFLERGAATVVQYLSGKYGDKLTS